MAQWLELLGEEHPSVHLLSTSYSSRDFYKRMHIPHDTRAYAMVIRNDGEILWASHDKFKEHLQEKEMVHTVHREHEWRIDEHERLLGNRPSAGAITATVDISEITDDDVGCRQSD